MSIVSVHHNNCYSQINTSGSWMMAEDQELKDIIQFLVDKHCVYVNDSYELDFDNLPEKEQMRILFHVLTNPSYSSFVSEAIGPDNDKFTQYIVLPLALFLNNETSIALLDFKKKCKEALLSYIKPMIQKIINEECIAEYSTYYAASESNVWHKYELKHLHEGTNW